MCSSTSVSLCWGFRTGLALEMLAASTFGTAGSRWLTGAAVGLANVAVNAVAIDFAVNSTLLGLLAWGLIDPAVLVRWKLGPLALGPPVFLGTALFWIFIISMANLLRLVGVVAALMRVYTPVALLVLTLIAIWDRRRAFASYQSRPGCRAAGESSISGVSRMRPIRNPAHLRLLCAGGAGERRLGCRREKSSRRRAGRRHRHCFWWNLAGRDGASRRRKPARPSGPFGRARGLRAELVPPLSFRWAILRGHWRLGWRNDPHPARPGRPCAGCYASWVYGRKLAACWPRSTQAVWVWVGGLIAFVLVGTSCASRY